MAGTWRIRHKLMLGLGLVVAIMALVLAGTLKGLLSYRAAMRTFDAKLAELEEADRLWPVIKELGDVPADARQAIVLAERIEAARAKLDKYREKLAESLNQGRDAGSPEAGQAQAIEQRLDKLSDAIAEAVNHPMIGAGADNLLAREKVKSAVDMLVGSAKDLNNAISDNIHQSIKTAKTDCKTSMWIVITTTVLGVLLMAGLLRWFYRWVFYPIRDLNQGVDRVARGDFDHRINVRSGDEIEDLAKAFNAMTGRLQEMYTDLAQKVNERSRQLVRSERLAGVGFLAAGVAHEINNPLAGIAFCSEALDSRLADLLAGPQAVTDQDREIVTKYLKMIQEEAFRCKEIIQRLLDFSRGGERRREPTEVGELIQGVLEVVQHLPNSRGKNIQCAAADRLVAWVNSQEIKSVVLNLVVNALDSMDDGGTLAISQRLHDGMVELVFKDTGCGMTAEVLENIFEPFFSRSRTGKGTGLGLSISHRIISQHGGEIEATSEGPGHGSTFIVRLPLKPPADQKDAAAEVLDPETEFERMAGRERIAA